MKKYYIIAFVIILFASITAAVFLRSGNPGSAGQSTGAASNRNLPLSQTDLSFTASKNHRIVFLADTRGSNNGVNRDALTKILKLIKALKPQPEYLVIAGDLVGGSKSDGAFLSQLNNAKSILTSFYPMSKILPGFGNHEDAGSSSASHDKIFQKVFAGFPKTGTLKSYQDTAYYLDDGNVRLIMLNSNYQGQEHEIANGQLDWLKSCTKKGNQKIKFVFSHEPPYPTGANIGYSLDVHPPQRDKFWQVLIDGNVMTLLCGHEHNYSRRLINKSFNARFSRSIFQIIAGTAGAPVYTRYTSKKGVLIPPVPVYHFEVIDIGKYSSTLTAVSINSKILDKVTLKNIS